MNKEQEVLFNALVRDITAVGFMAKSEAGSRLNEIIKLTMIETIETDMIHIGMLRQWLNEDKISDPKKMVTNEDILHFLQFGKTTNE